MNAKEVLDELKRCGVGLEADGEHLRLRAPVGVITDELRRRVLTCKPDLLRLLKAPARPAFRFVDGLMDWGDVCAGWTPGDWAIELRRKADRCDRYRPEIAEYFRGRAADIEARLNESGGSS